MISNLPRELLWTDKADISEFMSDELSNCVVSMNSYANSNITVALGAKIMLKLYNEAFYYSTRVVYEHDANAHPEAYMENILTDLGDKEMARYVICLMFNVLLLQSDKSKEVLQFIENLQKTYISNTPSSFLNWFNKFFKPRKNNASFRLNPCPCSADKLKGIDWNIITQGFSKQIIIDLLELWDSDNEKGKVIRLIENAYTSHQPELDDKEIKEKADGEFFTQQKNLYHVTKNVKSAKGDIENYFQYKPSEHLKESIMQVVKTFFQGKPSNLALIEIVLFHDLDLPKTRDNHKPLVRILKDWGALSKDLDETKTANGMSQKIRKLPEGTYKEWSEIYKRDKTKCTKIGLHLHKLNCYDR